MAQVYAPWALFTFLSNSLSAVAADGFYTSNVYMAYLLLIFCRFFTGLQTLVVMLLVIEVLAISGVKIASSFVNLMSPMNDHLHSRSTRFSGVLVRNT